MKEPIILIVFVLTIVLGGAYLAASQEARVFNRFSDKEATTWDALFAELRVEACN